ncbi:MAG TPA: toll/interleukin-1 receptor domain-containing protein [Pseudonocardiaceae bacterium]|nr:toll/interleukin-1 receptor domain-containing protein [Pseudonocardiaceae bacterium]
MGGGPGGDDDPDFFVSYTRSDQRWAEWIGWVLEADGFRVVMQAWDFGPGSHFVAGMHEALRRSPRTVVVLSAAYLTSVFAAAEWQAAWAVDPAGRGRRLLGFRVEDCDREGLLRQLVMNRCSRRGGVRWSG